MSADNWAICPRCRDERALQIQVAQEDVDAKYGHVTIEQFDQLRASVRALKDRPLERSFREDYEFYGAEDGEVTASYRGQCSKCQLTCRFEHTVRFYPEGNPR